MPSLVDEVCSYCDCAIPPSSPAYIVEGRVACTACHCKRRNEAAPTICQNCDKPIGRLETPSIHKGHAVCATCYARLNPPATPATLADINNANSQNRLAWILLFGLIVLFTAIMIKANSGQ